ncbi:hypothetical protein [Agromyces sp. PvR057]|uniref:hypothetical protein n=1 Tax=Agromyces sp. PvR057 TaxID=3156403 RepID=UPI000E22B1C6
MSQGPDREPRKRSAYEPPVLLAQPVQAPPTMPRPAATTLGAILVMLRVLAGVVWLVVLAITWRQVVYDEAGLAVVPGSEEDHTLNVVLIGILVAGGIGLLVVVGFGIAVYRGGNVARLLVMTFTSLSITVAAIDYFAGGEDITIRTTLLTLSLDILVMLALSSRAARAYARRPRTRRRQRRTGLPRPAE